MTPPTTPHLSHVQDVMSTDVATCHPDASLADACLVMWERGCGVLPVTEPATGRVLGILTDRDVALAACSRDRPPSDIRASAGMNEKVHGCRETDELSVAHAAMRMHRVRRLPVTSHHGELTGMLSLDDLARHAVASDDDDLRRAVTETLAAICRHRAAAHI